MNLASKFTDGLDTRVLLTVFGLIIIGLIALFSATYYTLNEHVKANLIKQIWWLLIGIFVFWGIISINPRRFYFSAYWIYALCILSLIGVLLLGQGRGVHRWIVCGPVQVQPAEFAKVGAILALSRFLSERDKVRVNDLKNIIIALLIMFLPVILIIRQPDLGTALVFFAIGLPTLYWAGLSSFTLFLIMAPVISFFAAFNFYAFFMVMILISGILYLSQRGVKIFTGNILLNIGVGILAPHVWEQLYTYQQKRILNFIGLETDPTGIGYQLIQSKVAIGSGGLLGKGFLQGTQTKLRFLPAQHTDFIISVIGEEFGFLGILIVLGLFLYFLLKVVQIAERTTERFSSLVAIGSVSLFAFHILVNVGMTVGIMPVAGLPLPFMSYGGSFLLVCLILVAFIINGYKRQVNY